MKRFANFVVDFLTWSWNDKEYNRIILCVVVTGMLGMAGAAAYVRSLPSPVADVHSVHTEIAYIELTR